MSVHTNNVFGSQLGISHNLIQYLNFAHFADSHSSLVVVSSYRNGLALATIECVCCLAGRQAGSHSQFNSHLRRFLLVCLFVVRLTLGCRNRRNLQRLSRGMWVDDVKSYHDAHECNLCSVRGGSGSVRAEKDEGRKTDDWGADDHGDDVNLIPSFTALYLLFISSTFSDTRPVSVRCDSQTHVPQYETKQGKGETRSPKLFFNIQEPRTRLLPKQGRMSELSFIHCGEIKGLLVGGFHHHISSFAVLSLDAL